MNVTQIKELLDRVKANRPSFNVDNNVVKEWTRVLQNYDYEDVDKRLDEYFNEPSNFGRIPDAHYITRYLPTIEEKQNPKTIKYLYCGQCKHKIPYEDFKEHKDRCDSVEYLIEESKVILNRELTENEIEILRTANQEKFDNIYYNFINKFYNTTNDLFKKKMLKNVLLTKDGHEPEFTIEEIMKEL